MQSVSISALPATLGPPANSLSLPVPGDGEGFDAVMQQVSAADAQHRRAKPAPAPENDRAASDAQTVGALPAVVPVTPLPDPVQDAPTDVRPDDAPQADVTRVFGGIAARVGDAPVLPSTDAEILDLVHRAAVSSISSMPTDETAALARVASYVPADTPSQPTDRRNAAGNVIAPAMPRLTPTDTAQPPAIGVQAAAAEQTAPVGTDAGPPPLGVPDAAMAVTAPALQSAAIPVPPILGPSLRGSPPDWPGTDMSVPPYWSLRTEGAPAEPPTDRFAAPFPQPVPTDVAPGSDADSAPPLAAPDPTTASSGDDPLAPGADPALIFGLASGSSSGSVAQGLSAPVQAAAPALPPTLGSDLGAILTRRPDGLVELSLAPEELGRLRVHLWPDGDALRIVVQAERPETLDMLRRNAEALMQEIRSAGFTGGSFSFSGWGGAQGSPQSPVARPAAFPAAASVITAPPPDAQDARPGLDLRL